MHILVADTVSLASYPWFPNFTHPARFSFKIGRKSWKDFTCDWDAMV